MCWIHKIFGCSEVDTKDAKIELLIETANGMREVVEEVNKRNADLEEQVKLGQEFVDKLQEDINHWQQKYSEYLRLSEQQALTIAEFERRLNNV